MKSVIACFLFLSLVSACTKEVVIDIPGYEEKVVIDGRIEQNAPPFVLLSKTSDIYAPTDLDAYLSTFIKGAKVTVSNGTTTVQLDEVCANNMPLATLELLEDFFGIEAEDLQNIEFCAYTSTNPAIWGEIGKSYTLTVEVDGKVYTSSTDIVPTVNLNNLFWKGDSGLTDYGFGWANLSDPPGEFNGYFMEVKRINSVDGEERDALYRPIFNPANNDEFFDGTTFDFGYTNTQSYSDPTVQDQYRGYYKIGDTVAVRFSSLDRNAHRFLYDKYIQLANGGNPFAVPTNIKTNIKGGALGAWLGYSVSWDTLICKP